MAFNSWHTCQNLQWQYHCLSPSSDREYFLAWKDSINLGMYAWAWGEWMYLRSQWMILWLCQYFTPDKIHLTMIRSGMDKKRDTHTEMRWDTHDEEQHTCPMFNTLMANVCHLFRNVCRILSTWYHTISINSATMFPFWIVRKSNVMCEGRISHYLCTSYTVHTLCKSSVVKSKSAFPCWSKIWDYKFYSLNYYTSSCM